MLNGSSLLMTEGDKVNGRTRDNDPSQSPDIGPGSLGLG